jgi:formylglycine-generating enzyme required for sulfatase activity
MEVAIGDLRYLYGWSDMCVGARPCTATFNKLDVHNLSDGTLVEGNLPTLCVELTRNGNPRPLVSQVRIPAADEQVTFPMGSDAGDADEAPVHDVTLSAFRLDVREATNADFAKFLTDQGNDCAGQPCADVSAAGFHETDGVWAPVAGSEDLPVAHVSWHGASAYCTWRAMMWLPSEAQWEMAASAGGERIFPWGDESPDCTRARFNDCGNQAAEVCSLPDGHSREGVCDLAGNLGEWVRDWYAPDFYAGCATDCTEPQGPVDPTGARVVRGGSFADPVDDLRAAGRHSMDPDTTSGSVGLRCSGWAGTPRE